MIPVANRQDREFHQRHPDVQIIAIERRIENAARVISISRCELRDS
jgi:hypothetical protein